MTAPRPQWALDTSRREMDDWHISNTQFANPWWRHTATPSRYQTAVRGRRHARELLGGKTRGKFWAQRPPCTLEQESTGRFIESNINTVKPA